MLLKKATYLLALYLCIVIPSLSQVKTDDVQKVEVPSSLLSHAISTQVYLPRAYNNSQANYPTIIMLDGSGYAELVSDLAHKLHETHRIPEVIVVGIDAQNRYRDFAGDNFPLFHKALNDELIPYLRKKYRLQDAIFGMGHSLAASFLLKNLGQEQQLFVGISASSPVISQRTELSVKQTKTLITQYVESGNHLFLTKGSETGIYQETIPNVAEAIQHTNFEFQALAQETHASLGIIAPYYGLSHFFSDYIPDTIENIGNIKTVEDIDKIGGYVFLKEYYQNWSMHTKIEQTIPDILLSRFAFTYINSGEYEKALELMETEVKNRSELIFYLSSALYRKGQIQSAKKLLLLDAKHNKPFERNTALLTTISDELSKQG